VNSLNEEKGTVKYIFAMENQKPYILWLAGAILLFFPLWGHAAPKNGFDIGLGAGYRKDEMAFSIRQGGELLYKESDRNLLGVALDAFLDLRISGLLWANRADFGWYVSGQTHDIAFMGVPALAHYRATFNQSARGFFADIEESLGFIFDFTDRKGGFKIVPQGGYSVFYQQLTRGSPHSGTNIAAAAMSCNLSHGRLRRQWRGWRVGGDVIYQLLHAWTFEASYFYYFLHFKQTFDAFEDMAYLAPGPIVSSEYFIRMNTRFAGSGAHGQCVNTKITAKVAEQWKVNWRLMIDWFQLPEKNCVVHQEFRRVLPSASAVSIRESATFQTWWHSLSSLIEVEYFF